MAETGSSRVIVGASGSLASLQALRRAVVEARNRGAELNVVHAYWYAYCLDPMVVGATCQSLSEAARQQASSCLQQALGGPPADLTVRVTLIRGLDAGHALVGQVRGEDDLVVVGASGGGRLHRGARTAAYCVRHARCPVLVVPPSRLARELGGASRRRSRRAERELAAELAAITTAPTV